MALRWASVGACEYAAVAAANSMTIVEAQNPDTRLNVLII
jgi:hypothetical protein